MKCLSQYYVKYRCPSCGVGTRDFTVNWLIGVEIVIASVVGFVSGVFCCNGGI